MCGDGFCALSEGCALCPADCGVCPAVCGNGMCEGGESCASCAVDCGVCPIVCGNGACEVGEDCSTCPADCGACGPVCGDLVCEIVEDCNTCPTDCGPCGPVCGDLVCAPGETCANCPQDCGGCNNCAHDKCSQGVSLVSGCDPCVTQICAADSFCCSNSWDSQCVSEVTSICGLPCGGGNCSHDKCVTGSALVIGCDACVTTVCAFDPFCCSVLWDSACVSEVTTFCGLFCP